MVDEYEGAWISTQHVKHFHFLDPTLNEIDIRDIAHATALTCRFGGHCSKFYSVAEHSVLISNILQSQGTDLYTQLAGLLHDAEEAYLPDIPRPIKQHMPEAGEIYEQLATAIYKKFGILEADWGAVKDADNRLVVAEGKALGVWNKDWAYMGESLEIKIECWPPETAEHLFMIRYRHLARRLKL